MVDDNGGGRRLIPAAKRRRGAVVIVARVVWKTPCITWPMTAASSDAANVVVTEEPGTRRGGDQPTQRMWRLARHPVSTMSMRIEVHARNNKGVDLLDKHRWDLACPLCEAVVPRTGSSEPAFMALNALLAHIDAEHVRLRVVVESHSFARPGRSGCEGGASG
eukprot:TRINITY_DN4430_c0_g1_i1.p3 TRINITY_DN4430_c0_g1~~TRINITY_DN4430_c0_g1_i1.p3  ORF type:complete len:163 (-),score=53.87 TRINITY_DN4430_c0_g1_i1:562-1050(-)